METVRKAQVVFMFNNEAIGQNSAQPQLPVTYGTIPLHTTSYFLSFHPPAICVMLPSTLFLASYPCAEPYVREVGRSDLGRYTCEAENTVGRAQAAILLSGANTRPRKYIEQKKKFG
jgi:hypothetical protein